MSFANIFCWQDSYHSQIAVWNDFLLIRFTTDNGYTAYMQPVGNGNRAEVIEALAADAASLAVPLRLFGLNSEWRDSLYTLFGQKVAISNLAANADYIYRSSDLAELAGRKYQPKRNFINRFTSRYNYRFEPITECNIDTCRALNALWCSQKGCSCTDSEQRAVLTALDNFTRLPLEGWILSVEGQACAFAIGSAVNHDTFCIHIEKIDTSFDGAGAMINNLVAVELQHRFKYINREDDLGIEGLRRAKMSYYPEYLLSKHSALILNQDEVQMAELWQKVFGDDRKTIDDFFVRVYDPALCFTHRANNRVVAMLHIVPLKENGQLSAYIYAVATAPQYRRQGIAHSLISRAITTIPKAGIYSRILLVPADRDAERLYSKFDFVMTNELLDQSESELDYDLGSGDKDADFVMVRKIY